MRQHGIKTYKTSVYNPQANLAERPLREISRMLRTYCHSDHPSWPEHIEKIEWGINLAHHDSIGMTPYQAMTGKNPERLVEQFIAFPSNYLETQEEITEKIKNILVISANKRKNRYDKPTYTNPKYKLGDKVLVRNHTLAYSIDSLSKKFMLIYVGPFEISRIK